jgi:hypothetical protein
MSGISFSNLPVDVKTLPDDCFDMSVAAAEQAVHKEPSVTVTQNIPTPPRSQSPSSVPPPQNPTGKYIPPHKRENPVNNDPDSTATFALGTGAFSFSNKQQNNPSDKRDETAGQLPQSPYPFSNTTLMEVFQLAKTDKANSAINKFFADIAIDIKNNNKDVDVLKALESLSIQAFELDQHLNKSQ